MELLNIILIFLASILVSIVTCLATLCVCWIVQCCIEIIRLIFWCLVWILLCCAEIIRLIFWCPAVWTSQFCAAIIRLIFWCLVLILQFCAGIIRMIYLCLCWIVQCCTGIFQSTPPQAPNNYRGQVQQYAPNNYGVLVQQQAHNKYGGLKKYQRVPDNYEGQVQQQVTSNYRHSNGSPEYSISSSSLSSSLSPGLSSSLNPSSSSTPSSRRSRSPSGHSRRSPSPRRRKRRREGFDKEESTKRRYQRILILKKKFSSGMNIPDILLQKHFLPYFGSKGSAAKRALELSKNRFRYKGTKDLIQNTVFENPLQIWKCTVVQDTSRLVFPETEVFVSDEPLQTYQCYKNLNQSNKWTVKHFGKHYAVFGTYYHFIDECLDADLVSIEECSSGQHSRKRRRSPSGHCSRSRSRSPKRYRHSSEYY